MDIYASGEHVLVPHSSPSLSHSSFFRCFIRWKTAIFCDHRTFSVNIAMCILSGLIKLLHIFSILFNLLRSFLMKCIWPYGTCLQFTECWVQKLWEREWNKTANLFRFILVQWKRHEKWAFIQNAWIETTVLEQITFLHFINNYFYAICDHDGLPRISIDSAHSMDIIALIYIFSVPHFISISINDTCNQYFVIFHPNEKKNINSTTKNL